MKIMPNEINTASIGCATLSDKDKQIVSVSIGSVDGRVVGGGLVGTG